MNTEQALTALSQLPLGEGLNLGGFGIITTPICDKVRAILLSSPEENWQEGLYAQLPEHAEDLMHAIYLCTNTPRNKGVGLIQALEDETEIAGGQGFTLERMLAHTLNNSPQINAHKTPEFIDGGGKTGPGLDIIMNDKKRQIRWGLTITMQRTERHGSITFKHREDLAHLKRSHLELQLGEQSQTWYSDGNAKYPGFYTPDKLMNLNFCDLGINTTHTYWAYQEWSKGGYKGQLHDFLPNPGRERLEYFYAIFDTLMEALSETGKKIPHVKRQNYPLPDNGEIRRYFIKDFYVFDIHMHDRTGFPVICSIHVPGGAGKRFMQDIFADMEKLGWSR